MLQEDKPSWAAPRIASALKELRPFKHVPKYKVALDKFFEAHAPEAKDAPLKIGIGFWASSDFRISHLRIDLSDLDYFVYVHPNMTQWSVWSNGTPPVGSPTGAVTLPEFFLIDPARTTSISRLEKQSPPFDLVNA